MTDFYSQNRCVCSTRSHGPLLCAFCLSFHFKVPYYYDYVCFPSISHPLIQIIRVNSPVGTASLNTSL